MSDIPIWPRRDKLLYQVFKLPDDLPDGYCFGGGKPVTFQLVDWFGPPPERIQEQGFTHEDLRAFLRQKNYYKAGGSFVVIRNDGAVFTLLQPKLEGRDDE